MQPAPGERVDVPPQVARDGDDQQKVESNGAKADWEGGIGNAKWNHEVDWADPCDRVDGYRQHVQGNERDPADGKEPVQVREIAIAHGALEHRATQCLPGDKGGGKHEEGGERRRARRQPEELVNGHAAAGRTSGLAPAPATSAGTAA